ncbi:sensor domain-containing diguanylate cyclase [Vreelandella zhuhanensis]|nr:diguanylate cyclase [Halomonas zhuhanensis]
MFSPFIASLRTRFFLALGGVLLGALFALVMMGKWIILPALLEEERSLASQELDQLERSLNLNQKQLLAQVRDWATWDDTYDFVQGNNPRYAQVNFSQNMFEEMGYQLMVFFNADQEVYWVAGLDPQSGDYTSCSTASDACAWAAPFLQPMQASLASIPEQGLSSVYTQPGLALVATNSILHTDESGPTQGWLFKVQKMDSEFKARMQSHTGLEITLDTVAADVKDHALHSIEGSSMHARRLLPTAQEGIMLALGTRLHRDHYRASFTTFVYALLWTGALMLLVIVTVLLLLECMVLKPLRTLTKFTHRLQFCEQPPRLTQRLKARNDEIGMLARGFEAQLQRQQHLTDELRELSTRDALTGLPNRRFFDAKLADAVSNAHDTHTPLGVMMLDIDHFKLFNDQHGHPEGDKCLVIIADCMQQFATLNDVLIARTGGEEFSAILPNHSEQALVEIAQKLRDTVCSLAYPHAFSPVAPYITVSVGIASYEPNNRSNSSSLMRAADQALYQAKHAGRNRVKLFNTPSTNNAAAASSDE